MSASVTHAEYYSFVTKWGVDIPFDIAVDSLGNVYVTGDYCYIYKFDSNGTLLTKWDTSGCDSTAFDVFPVYNGPRGVAVDSLGNVYASVSENFTRDEHYDLHADINIQKFDSNGKFITKWGSSGSGDGQFNHSQGVAVDSSGNVYVADYGNNRIQKFDSNGAFITKWGSKGNGDEQFNNPRGVAVDSSGNVYVADSGNCRIEKFDSSGKFITKWGSEGSGDGQFYYPCGVAVDSKGNVYVTDDGNNHIQKFDSNGAFITKWGSSGSGYGQFIYPWGVAVDSLGYVYVADYDSCCIQKFAPVAFNVTPSKIRITDNVQFNASESVNGTESGILWEFGDGLTDESGQSVVNHNYSKPGSYVVNLTIIDSTGAPKKTSQIVNVTIPVLLVHGWGSSSDMWQGMSAALQKEGFEVWNFDYKSSNTADPRTISPKLAANITERRSDLSYNGQKYTGKIDVICHSMGAVVSRLYMEKDDGGIHGKDVRQWIGIAPAHGGAASADTLGVVKYTNPVLYFLRWAYNPALSELKTTSSTVNSLGPLSPTTKYWVIAGWNPTQSPKFGNGVSATLAKNETGSYYWTYSGDMIVATQQSYNKDMEFEAFPPVSGDLGGSPAYEFDHTHICNSPKVIAYVIDCLKNINKHSSKQIPPEEKVNYYTFFKKSVEGALGTVKKLITLPLSVPVFGSSNGESSQMMAMSNTGATVQATEDNVLYVLLDWDQGDVDMSLISPSGVEYTEDSHPDNVWFLEEENSITAIVVNPESGDWKSNLDPVSYPGQDIVYTLTSILRTSSESEIIPFANFTANVTEGYVPLSVQFTDKSENVTEWNWDFGDADTSPDPSPTHTYYTAGNYTVNLTVSNTYGTDSKLSTITVLEKTIVPVANFSAQPTSGKAPLKVYFTDQSTGTPTKWKWSFGGGITSFQQNPVHKYSAAGKYTVTFTTTNAKGSNTVTETDYIKVISKPVANFTSSVTSGKASLNVKFTDTSTGTPSGWIWEFGDGSKSFVENPTHKYSEAETYTVNLTVKNAAGRNTVTKTKYIKVITKPAANFTSSVTSGKAPLNVKFTDISTGTPSGWIWEFGDGLKSFVENPTHKYSKAGTYTVNLTVKNAAGRGTVTRTEYIKVV
jgi:PKD repeat protein